MGDAWDAVTNAFTGTYRPTPSSEWRKPDCLVVHAFGLVQAARDFSQRSPRLGQTNEELAAYIEVNGLGRLPKIMQIEVQRAYEELSPGSLYPIYSITENRSRGAYLDTREVNAQAASIMEHYGYRNAVIVAQAHHVMRAARTLRRMGVGVVIPPGLPKDFDRKAEQTEVRSAIRFGLRSAAAVAIYRFHGWI